MPNRTAPESRGAQFLVNAVSLAVAAILAVGLLSAFASKSRASELLPWTDGPKPAFVLQNLGGADVNLESYRGRVLLVHFFATWCEPCREELPALSRLIERAGGTKIAVLAISVAEVDLRVRRFMETMPVKFPVLLDRDRAVTKAWDVSALPTTFVLDENLQPKLLSESDFAWDSVEPGKLIDMIAAHGGKKANATEIKANPNQNGG